MDNNIWNNRSDKGIGAGIDPFGSLLKNKYIDYIHKKYLSKVIKKYINKYDDILDFGCGNGRFTFYFKNFFKKVVGIDLSEGMINEAKKQLKGNEDIRFIYGDILEYDILHQNIFSCWTLQHILDKDMVSKIIQKLYTILANNGTLIIIDQTRKNIIKEKYKGDYYKILRTKNNIVNLFLNKGFVLKEIIEIPERTYGISRIFIDKLPNFLFLIPVLSIIDKISSYFTKYIFKNKLEMDTMFIFIKK